MIEPHSIEYSPSNEDGLAYVYFSYGQHEYFTLARTSEEEPVIYLERNDQSLALESNNVSYTLSGNTVVFTMGGGYSAGAAGWACLGGAGES